MSYPWNDASDPWDDASDRLEARTHGDLNGNDFRVRVRWSSVLHFFHGWKIIAHVAPVGL